MNNKNKEGGQKKDEKPEKMGRPHDKDGCRQTSKESRGGKASRNLERGQATAEMGGLRKEGYEKFWRQFSWSPLYSF